MTYDQLNMGRIDPLLCKENFLLCPLFPKQGIIPLRVSEREMVTYRYRDIGLLTSDEWVEADKLAQTSPAVTNILEVLRDDEILHLFYTVEPSGIRVYPDYPLGQARRRLPRVARTVKSDMGFVDGFESPTNCPSPQTEEFILPQIDVGFAFWNTERFDARVVLGLIATRYRVKVVKDVDLIMGILTNKVPCRIATLGGIGVFSYTPEEHYGISAIPLDSTRAQVASIIAAATMPPASASAKGGE